jgi:transposase
LRTRAIAEAKVKTDKVDAESLAQLLRCDYLPEVWQPDQETQQLRELSVQRSGLVADQTRLKNRVRRLA